MIIYNIHNIVNIYVSKDVNKSIQENINFQIGFFKRDNLNKTKYSIYVKPFIDFKKPGNVVFSTFHLVEGVWGKYYYDFNGKICIEKTDNGYIIYADSPNFLINLFIQFCLIEEGITCIHAAAIAKGNEVILLPGPGGVGKTAILGYSVKKNGDKILGDDIILVNKNARAYAFPRAFVFKEYHKSIYPEVFKRILKKNTKEDKRDLKKDVKKIITFIFVNMPLKDFIKRYLKKYGFYKKIIHTIYIPEEKPLDYVATVSIEDIFGNNIVKDTGIIKHIVFLERYSGFDLILEKISQDDLQKRLFSIIHHEWVGIMRQFYSLGALGIIDVENYFNKTGSIINSLCKNKKSRILKIPNEVSLDKLSVFFLNSVR